jgi:hypothetical protein
MATHRPDGGLQAVKQKVMRVVGGGLVALVIITLIGVALTPATVNESLRIGAIGASIIAIFHWFIEESREGTF